MPPCAECKAPTCWKEKTKLEKILIASLIFTTALALAISCAYIATLLSGKDKEKETKSSKDDNVCLTESCIFATKTILENMDSKVQPCEDFYNFACGNFIRKTIIPEDRESVNSWSDVKESLLKQMKYLLEEPIQPNELGPFKMIKTFYKTCMNVDFIEKDGLNTFRTILKDLGGWPVLEGDKWAEIDWKNLTYSFRKVGFFDVSLLKIYVYKDLFHSNRRVLYIGSPPSDRKQRLHKRGWTEEEVKKAYFRYMVDTAVLFGADRNRSDSELREAFVLDGKISDLANKTDKISKLNVTTLQQIWPNFAWMEFINNYLLAPHNIKVSGDEELIVNVDYLLGLEPLLQTASKRTIANYMIWRFIYYCTPFLNRALVEARLKYTQVFTGVSIRGRRWEHCLNNFMVPPDFVDSVPRESLFIAVGALYVRKYVSKKIKEDVQEMISNIHRSFQFTLGLVKWMDAKTQKKALDKAKAMIMNTAYPDEFLDDKKLLQFYDNDIELDESYLKSVLKLNLFDIRHNFKILRERVNRKDWIEKGQVSIINAFYDKLTNSINVPAGILQKQLFSNGRPNYLNYGAIGVVIGHEITHGFDDRGRRFDRNGYYVNWWSPKSEKSFANKTMCIAGQYSKYKLPELNMTVNGKLTLTENIADNGGFLTSYKAYQKWVKKHGVEKALPGLKYTPNQLFWISLANGWCSKDTPESLQHVLSTQDHSPFRFRVIGSLTNYKEFAKDFHCSSGSKMNPKQKCTLWQE